MGTSPVVVVGAGPVGLAAAAELVERDVDVVVLERGETAGAAVSEWGHVRLFSAWKELVDPAAARLLETHGWRRPADGGYPTGTEWVASYLRPVADALGDRVRFGIEVIGVARRGRDLVVDAGRETEPFTVHVRHSDGTEERYTARGLIDASGTWGNPNPLGGDGLPAIGEHAAADRITHHVPDLTDPAQRARFAGRHVAVAGSGHSALTTLVELTRQTAGAPGTTVTWLLRRGEVGDTFGGGRADQLPARGALGRRARRAVEEGTVRIVTGFRTAEVARQDDGRLSLTAESGQRVGEIDEVIALTGFRPDLSWLSELRLELDSTLQAPVKLAPMIDPNVHSCGSVSPHGVLELRQPEPGVYLAGMKSYGRAPTFLALTGFEQVRSIAAEFAGDRASAEQVELVLPESGVCGGSGAYDDTDGGGCCGPSAAATSGPELITLTVPAPGRAVVGEGKAEVSR